MDTSGATSLAQNSIHNISMIELIANSEKYMGERVKVIGFLVFKFESSAIYLSSLDHKHSVTKNAIWVDPENMDIDKLTELSNSYVLVEGVFSSENKGHLGRYSGAITKISRIIRWGE